MKLQIRETLQILFVPLPVTMINSHGLLPGRWSAMPARSFVFAFQPHPQRMFISPGCEARPWDEES